MPPDPLEPPNTEAILVRYLRGVPAVVARVGADETRIGTRHPTDRTKPWLRLTRIGGTPSSSRPLYLDRPLIQLEAYGGAAEATSQDEAHALTQACRAWLPLAEEADHTGGVITAVRLGNTLRLVDHDFTPARERYLTDATVYAHPLPPSS